MTEIRTVRLSEREAEKEGGKEKEWGKAIG